MRRNIHQWFVIGFAMSILSSISLFFVKDAAEALQALAVWQIVYLSICVSIFAMRRFSNAMFSDRAVVQSRELPCRVMHRGGLATRRTYARG